MSFDTDPRYEKEQYPCDVCGGDVSRHSDGCWYCDDCDKKMGEK